MTESELKQKIIDKILELKSMMYKREEHTMMIGIWKVVKILEDLLEVNQDEKTNRTNKTIN